MGLVSISTTGFAFVLPAARILLSGTIPDATEFLKSPDFDFGNPTETYVYQITYSNGAEFERQVDSLEELRRLHEQTDLLAAHMASL